MSFLLQFRTTREGRGIFDDFNKKTLPNPAPSLFPYLAQPRRVTGVRPWSTTAVGGRTPPYNRHAFISFHNFARTLDNIVSSDKAPPIILSAYLL